MTAPEEWFLHVFETLLRYGRPAPGYVGAIRLLEKMADDELDDNPYHLVKHDYIFLRDKRTETSECMVCGHKLVGTYQQRSENHVRLHINQVRFALGEKGQDEPLWTHVDEALKRARSAA